jgi:tetratricopeptide (TPR) repeat protein
LSPDYLPALVNMGNLEYLAGELKVALRYFEKASDLAPENPTVLLGISRINHDLENYGIVNESYKRLKEVKPDLARRFSYLDLRGDEAEKAAAIGNVKEEMVWEE